MCACSATWRPLTRRMPAQSRSLAQWSASCAAWPQGAGGAGLLLLLPTQVMLSRLR